MATFLLISLILATWCIYNACYLLLNYPRASKLSIPIFCIPISPDNPLWIALQTAFSLLFKYVPFSSFSVSRYCRLRWDFHDGYKTHERLGDTWILITPDRNWFHTSKAEAAYEILTRSRGFGRPVWMMNALNVFRPNFVTAEGSNRQRQRKLTATPFNEQKSCLVWDDSIRQASDMAHLWLSDGSEGLKSTSEDTRTLALNVLAYVGFQRSYPFKSIAKTSEVRQPINYKDSLSVILRNVLVVIVLPTVAFQVPFMPTKRRQIGWAISDSRRYMLDQLADEKRLIAEGKPESGTLMNNLVRALEAQHDVVGGGDNKRIVTDTRPHEMKPLSVDEILACYFLLVAHPEVQDWVAKEFNFHLDADRGGTWRYETVFPKLKRCLAILLETLRLYNPIPRVPRYTGHQYRVIRAGGPRDKHPRNTLVVANLMALQTHPRYWGQDSLTWRPARWTIGSPHDSRGDPSARLAQGSLLVPEKGTFIPWSESARSCPGKKFVQGEFVATMAALFSDLRAELVSKAEETPAAVSKRVLEVVEDSNMELLLHMRNPDSVSVKWTTR